MKNWKLSMRLGAGFGALILIIGLLGGVAIYFMHGVQEESTLIADEYIPEVEVANNLERNALLTMYAIRGYGLTGNDTYLNTGRDNLEDVKHFIDEAVTLAQNSSQLTTLESAVKEMRTAVDDYEVRVDETVEANATLAEAKTVMDASAAEYMEQCAVFLDGQNKKMIQDMDEGIPLDGLKERLQKITLINDIIDLGNAVRVQNFKAQAANDPAMLDEALANFPQIDQKMTAIREITREAKDIAVLNVIETDGNNYKGAIISGQETMRHLRELAQERDAAGDIVLNDSKEVAEKGIAEAESRSQEGVGALKTATSILIFGSIIAAILGVLIAFFMTRSIANPLRRIIDTLSSGAEQVTAASSQVSQSSQELASGSTEQASSIEETSASLEEMDSMTKQNRDGAKRANKMAEEAMAAAETGNTRMEQTMVAINDVSASADETSKIIKTIDEIAFQTNLLALNAAVEAARAGEAGQGFAVVADEVRNLAQRAAEAAKTTAELIEGSKTNTDKSVAMVKEVGESLEEITQHSKKVNELVREIAVSSDEQSEGIEQINVAMAQVDEVTQGVAANAEESAAASEELNAQADTLLLSVEELQAMIEGQRNSVTTGSNGHTRRKTAKRASNKTTMNGNGQGQNAKEATQSSNGNHDTSGETLIPFDDDDEANFSEF